MELSEGTKKKLLNCCGFHGGDLLYVVRGTSNGREIHDVICPFCHDTLLSDVKHVDMVVLQQLFGFVRRSAPKDNWYKLLYENFDFYYPKYLQSIQWRYRRNHVLKDAKCRSCSKNPATEVHHINYKSAGREKVRDLMPICRPCHRRIHHERQ